MTNDIEQTLSRTSSGADTTGILRIAEVSASTTAPVKALAAELGPGPFALVTLFVTPNTDFSAVVKEAESFFPNADVVACTTAGELGANGYAENLIVATGFPAGDFVSKSILITDIGSDLLP